MESFQQRKKRLLAPVFHEAGAALYDCQLFEHSISLLLYLFSELGIEGFSREKATLIHEGEEKRTAGQLVGILTKYINVPAESEDLLKKALSDRNRIIHRYFIENVEKFPSQVGREEVVKEIKGVRSTLLDAIKHMDALAKALFKEIHGLDADADYDQVVSEFMGRGEEA